MKCSKKMISGAGLAALAFTWAVHAERPCPPDIDCSGEVDVDDLVAVVIDWESTDSDADVDGSGVVGIDDLIEVILTWGACQFDFGPPRDNAEAEQISLELLGPDGPLLPSDALYERVDRDLMLIRAAVPALASESHSQQWIPDELLVQRLQGVDLQEYQCVNTYYQVIKEDHLFSSGGADWFVLTFAGNLNVEALIDIYAQLDSIGVAEPNSLIGGQNTWTATVFAHGDWRWSIDDGWHDCFDGCDCHRLYIIDVDARGNVDIVQVTESGAPWCEF